MGQFPQPEVVGLLIQQGRHRKLKWITSFDVQLLTECRLTDTARECQAVDLLIIIMFFVLLPMRVDFKPISSGIFRRSMTSWWGLMRCSPMARLGRWNRWGAGWCSLGGWTLHGRWAWWWGHARCHWIWNYWWRWCRWSRWKTWSGWNSRWSKWSWSHSLIHQIRSRLRHVHLRSTLRSVLRSGHLRCVPDCRLHWSNPSRKKR